jgi:hypothetical protein
MAYAHGYLVHTRRSSRLQRVNFFSSSVLCDGGAAFLDLGGGGAGFFSSLVGCGFDSCLGGGGGSFFSGSGVFSSLGSGFDSSFGFSSFGASSFPLLSDFSPLVSIFAISWPTVTVESSSTRSSVIVPDSGALTATSI